MIEKVCRCNLRILSTRMSGVEIMNDTCKKITLVGDGGVGKTTFLRRHATGQFDPRYIPTESCGLTACPLRRPTRTGRHVVYHVWDGAGQEKYDARRPTATWAGTDAFLVMFDLTRLSSYQNARWWIGQVQASHPTVPIVLVGMKSESPARKLASEQVTLHRAFGIPYVQVSTKHNAINAPFECLERLLVL